MSQHEHIDDILSGWQHDPFALSVRMVVGSDGRDVIQLRVDMGVLQLEVTGRPDGTRPDDEETYCDVLDGLADASDSDFVLDVEQCAEVDREFAQFYHRRICWLRLRKYALAIKDADQTLRLMDICERYSPDDEWTAMHEQYRPFVMFHRIQAQALEHLEEENPDMAIQSINDGLEQMRVLYVRHDAEDHFDDDELVERLREMRESMREEYEVGRTLREQLDDAVASENYELAARLRDRIARRDPLV